MRRRRHLAGPWRAERCREPVPKCAEGATLRVHGERSDALNAILDFAPPLVLAALGGVLSERAGVVNIGLEGMMRFGAFAAAAGAISSGSPWFGLLCGALAGAAAAAVHALLSLRFRADQVVSGIALNLVALGLVTWLLQATFGSSVVSPPAPLLPRDHFGHSVLAYAALGFPLVF